MQRVVPTHMDQISMSRKQTLGLVHTLYVGDIDPCHVSKSVKMGGDEITLKKTNLTKSLE